MQRLCLTLMVVLTLGCAADPEPKAEDPAPTGQPPAGSVAAPDGAAEDAGAPEEIPLVGGSKVGRIKSDDWKRVDGYTAMFYSGDLEALHAEFSEAARQELPIDALTAMRDGLLAEHGEEIEVVDTAKEEKDGYRAYKRAARFSRGSRLIEVAWVIGPDDAIAGLFVTPDRSGSQ